jgi:hypothetical protein
MRKAISIIPEEYDVSILYVETGNYFRPEVVTGELGCFPERKEILFINFSCFG